MKLLEIYAISAAAVLVTAAVVTGLLVLVSNIWVRWPR